jgi:hypothetical protein
MSYFQKFPNYTSTIEGKNKTLVDISYAYDADPSDYSATPATSYKADEIGGLSLELYQNAEDFWALMFANEQINPWEVIPEEPSAYQDRNSIYSSAVLRFSGTKNNPETFLNLKEGDIIIPWLNTYSPGVTAAESIFPTDPDIWHVQKAYSDTKKAKITPNLKPGGDTGAQDLANPDIVSLGYNFYVLRKTNGQYGLVINPYTTTTALTVNLKTYKFTESPVEAIEKTTKSKTSYYAQIAAFNDTPFTVLEEDAPNASASLDYNQIYNTIPVKQYQQAEYQEQSQVVYIQQAAFGRILNKLI